MGIFIVLWITAILVCEAQHSYAQQEETSSSMEKGAQPELGEHATLDSSDIIIIVRSQEYKLHAAKAENLKINLLQQSEKLNGGLNVSLLHQDLNSYGAWTILPIISRLPCAYSFLSDDSYSEECQTSKAFNLVKKYEKKAKWIFLCEENTQINLAQLLTTLSRYDHKEELFLGHALYDREPAIIHHFAFAEDVSKFAFPDFAAGWAISSPLLRRMLKRLSSKPPGTDFSIDVQHEVAMFIFNKGKGVRLTHVNEFCINGNILSQSCATSVKREEPECGVVDVDAIFVAVKTCKKYHNDRVPVVMNTVKKEAKHIIFFSDEADPTIPTEAVGIPNTELGHCAKLFKILAITNQREALRKKPWIVVIDDDTIMSFDRLRRLLACYDPKEPILLGEKYGYGVNYNTYGYDYITGGGGMVLSQTAIRRLLSEGCDCPSADTPDDMWLGNCFRRMGYPLVHTPSFHQAQPTQYAEKLLQHQFLVSFHKHQMIPPMDVYNAYLKTEKESLPKDEL